MSNNNNNSGDKGEIGCVILALIIFGGGILIQVLQTLIMVAIVGGIGFGLYRLFVYDQRTGNITSWFEETFKVDTGRKKRKKKGKKKKKKKLAAQKQSLLESGIVDKLDTLHEEVTVLRQENENLKGAADEAVRKYADTADRKAKEDLLRNVYGESTPQKDYARSDEYEKQQHQDRIKKKEEELEIRELKQEVNERMLSQDESILGIRSEMHDGFQSVNDRFLQLEYRMVQMHQEFQQGLMEVMKAVQSLKMYFDEKINRLEIHVERELSSVRELVSGLRAELKQDVANVRVQFGKEIVRLDKQQNMIVGQLAQYEATVRAFSADMTKMKYEVKQVAWQGQQALDRAHTIYQRHKVEMSAMGNELDVALKQIAVHKGDFANTVGRSKLLLDKISQEQYLTLKDIGYERAGVELLRTDYQSRQEKEAMKLQMIQQDITHKEQMIRDSISRGKEVAGLNHQLSMSRENEAYTRQKLGIVRQEAALVRRLVG